MVYKMLTPKEQKKGLGHVYFEYLHSDVSCLESMFACARRNCHERGKILLQITHAHTSSVGLRKKFESYIHLLPHCWNIRTQTRMPVDDSANTGVRRLGMIGTMSCDRAHVTVSYLALGEPFVRSREVSVRIGVWVRAMDRMYLASGIILVEHALEL